VVKYLIFCPMVTCYYMMKMEKIILFIIYKYKKQ
jgi:hypothetical protein